MVRQGFSVVEVIVAMTLLSVGSLAVAATGIVSLQTFTRAELQERALRDAEALLDSLVAGTSVSAGARSTPRVEMTWPSADSTGVVTVTVQIDRRVTFELRGSR